MLQTVLFSKTFDLKKRILGPIEKFKIEVAELNFHYTLKSSLVRFRLLNGSREYLDKPDKIYFIYLGWSSIVGDWSRVEGTPDDPDPNKPFAKMENNPLFNNAGMISIFLEICQKFLE